MKISPEIDAQLRARAAKGATSLQLVEWLKTEHGLTVTSRTIRLRMKAARQEQAEMTRAAVRETLAVTVVTDADRLERIRRRVAKQAKRIENDKNRIREWALLQRLQVAILDRKLHYAGADTPEDVHDELAAAGERVRGRLARLAPTGGEGGDPP